MRHEHQGPFLGDADAYLREQLAREGTPDAFLHRQRAMQQHVAPSPAFWRGLIIGVFITVVLLFAGVVGFLAVQLAFNTLN